MKYIIIKYYIIYEFIFKINENSSRDFVRPLNFKKFVLNFIFSGTYKKFILFNFLNLSFLFYEFIQKILSYRLFYLFRIPS